VDYYLTLIEGEINDSDKDCDRPIKKFFKNKFMLNSIIHLTELVEVCPKANLVLHYFVSKDD